MYTFTTANADFVTDRIVVGGDFETRYTGLALTQLRELVDAGVTHIIDTRVERDDRAVVAEHAPHIEYLHLGVDDDGQRKPNAWFDTAVAWIDEALRSPDSTVLVHCHMGINRSPSLVFAYLLHSGVHVPAALNAIRTARSIAVIDYAAAALDWHHTRTQASARKRSANRAALDQWRSENHLDANEVVRTIRANETLTQAAHDLTRVSNGMRDADGHPLGYTWLFQMSSTYAENCRDDWNDGIDSWILPISRHEEEVLPGDVVLLWQMGGGNTAGLFGYAVVTETDLQATRPRRWDEPDGPTTMEKAVEAELILVANEPFITRTLLKPVVELSQFELFVMPNRPNMFAVTHSELDAIAGELRKRTGILRRLPLAG
ncbi:dual specificity protein phosphatase family protein [Tessaracoccus sp. OS52]|uniref:dual specificity protein phosphatase family protein n=1 Tax=Tessaracoccus sp. OS52 TaxID=2886691 RepID=UPI001D10CB65|nr:dual specificity protein phosphatase family protein [Tessaracoccus sp. OS52]MCC2593785.1 dual specificity protein phosphatase family protein [Tessaracoccus sp. OS52]